LEAEGRIPEARAEAEESIRILTELYGEQSARVKETREYAARLGR